MATKLDKVLKREIEVDGQAYMVAISPEGVKLTQKGYRKGQEMSWKAIITGESALAQDLRGSVNATGGGDDD